MAKKPPSSANAEFFGKKKKLRKCGRQKKTEKKLSAAGLEPGIADSLSTALPLLHATLLWSSISKVAYIKKSKFFLQVTKKIIK